jgi:hypothetical protein
MYIMLWLSFSRIMFFDVICYSKWGIWEAGKLWAFDKPDTVFDKRVWYWCCQWCTNTLPSFSCHEFYAIYRCFSCGYLCGTVFHDRLWMYCLPSGNSRSYIIYQLCSSYIVINFVHFPSVNWLMVLRVSSS